MQVCCDSPDCQGLQGCCNKAPEYVTGYAEKNPKHSMTYYEKASPFSFSAGFSGVLCVLFQQRLLE